MPHLSPMNWMMALLSFWIILLIMSSIQWWNQPSSFPTKTSLYSSKMTNLWKWL